MKLLSTLVNKNTASKNDVLPEPFSPIITLTFLIGSLSLFIPLKFSMDRVLISIYYFLCEKLNNFTSRLGLIKTF